MFETDIQADDLPRLVMLGGGASNLGGEDQALIAAPAISHAEKRHIIQHGGEAFFVYRVNFNSEKPSGAGEIALPQIVSGGTFEAGVQNLADKIKLRQKSGNLKRRLLMLFEPCRQRPHTAQSEKYIIRGGAQAKQTVGMAQITIDISIGANRAEQGVGVADNIFGCRLDG